MLSDDVEEFIGKGGDVRIYEVEKGAIRRFADAVDDPNPLFHDDEYARNSRNGAIIAPPGFFGWQTHWPAATASGALAGGSSESGLGAVLAKAGYTRILDGGVDYEFFMPIRAGDTLAVTSKLKDVRERAGGTGKMAIVRNESTYHNQNGNLVATAIATGIYR